MKRLIFFISIGVLLCCREKPTDPAECAEDSFLLSTLRTHTDHLHPFTLCNDLEESLTKIILNNEEINPSYGSHIVFERSGFFTMVLDYEENTANDTILFTVVSPQREHAEWGIPEWTPLAETPGSLPECEIVSIYPKHFISGISVPFIFYLIHNGEKVDGYYTGLAASDLKKFSIKHGQGSVTLHMNETDQNVIFSIGTDIVSISMEISDEMPRLLSGEINSNLEISANSIYRVSGDLHIPAGTSLTVGAGALILIDKGINILNQGEIVLNGSPENPVFITCTDSSEYWGGFISNGLQGNINASIQFSHAVDIITQVNMQHGVMLKDRRCSIQTTPRLILIIAILLIISDRYFIPKMRL